MAYFKTLSFVFGGLAVLSSIFLLLNAPAYQKLVSERIYPEKKQLWHQILLIVLTVFVIYSWKLFFEAPKTLYLVVCLFLLLGLGKAFLIAFYYRHFRQMVLALVSGEKTARVVIAVSSLAIGAGLIVTGVLIS